MTGKEARTSLYNWSWDPTIFLDISKMNMGSFVPHIHRFFHLQTVGSSAGSASAASARRMAASAASRKPSTAAWGGSNCNVHREKAWETLGVWWNSPYYTLFQTIPFCWSFQVVPVPEIMTCNYIAYQIGMSHLGPTWAKGQVKTRLQTSSISLSLLKGSSLLALACHMRDSRAADAASRVQMKESTSWCHGLRIKDELRL